MFQSKQRKSMRETDSKAKREALEKAYEDIGIIEPEIKSWDKDSKLKAFLKSLV